MQTLTSFGDNLREIASSIDENTFKKRISFTVNCSYLPVGIISNDVFQEPAIDTIFKSLYGIRQPVVYWFTIRSFHDSKQIYERMLSARKKIPRRFPAQPEFRGETKVLYVGKVKRNIYGRMITHFGYDENPEAHGLQLSHWAQRMGIKLELNCLILPNELQSLIYYIEAQLSQELQPLIGIY